jgi:hypothetical protein
MPTDCDPWPGNTKADEVIVVSVAAESVLTRPGLCDNACIFGEPVACCGILRAMTDPSASSPR